MPQTPRTVHAYRDAAVTTASPAMRVAMLYDRAIVDVRRFGARLAAGERAAAGEAVQHGLAILGELRAALDPEAGGDLSANLDRLYDFCAHRLGTAHRAGDTQGADDVLRVLEPLAEAWHAIAER